MTTATRSAGVSLFCTNVVAAFSGAHQVVRLHRGHIEKQQRKPVVLQDGRRRNIGREFIQVNGGWGTVGGVCLRQLLDVLQAEGRDGLRRPVFENLEVFRRQVGHQLSLRRYPDVHEHHIGLAA